jgi:hypothetical protein
MLKEHMRKTNAVDLEGAGDVLSASALIRPCSEKSLDTVQYALVVIRSLQRRPKLTQLSRIADHTLWRPREQ